METMSQATTRLRAAGYVEHWIASDGRLSCPDCAEEFDPAAVVVDEVVRFEGTSDPDDEAILFALQGPCGHRGQYGAAYGPAASVADAEVITALSRPPSSPAPPTAG